MTSTEKSRGEYGFHISVIDVDVALKCEADRAEREGFAGVAKNQRATALHLRNAQHHMQKLCPDGYRVEARIVFTHVPDVNPVLKDEHRK